MSEIYNERRKRFQEHGKIMKDIVGPVQFFKQCKEYECIASRYDDYVAGVKAIRPQMRDECGQNSSYLISLIHHLL